MQSILELNYADYVKVGDAVYYVWQVNVDHSTAELVPIDALEHYASDEDALAERTETFPVKRISRIPTVKVGEDVLRSLFRMDVTSWQLVKQGQYPFGAETGKFQVTEEDVLTLIKKLMSVPSQIEIDAWNENYSGYGTYQHADYPKRQEPGFSLAFLCEKLLDLMDWIDIGSDDWKYIGTLGEDYLKSKGKPLKETVIPDDFKGDILSDIQTYAKRNCATEEMREYYIATLEELCQKNDRNALERKAYAYYGGNSVVLCDWKKSEEALLVLFELEKDPYVANSLGYIYCSDRLGTPDYQKAFYYFDYAASDGVVEATYKLSDLYRKGQGTEKNPAEAWELLMRAYEWCDEKKKDRAKYPDIMLRIGYCYRDGVGVEKDIAKAMECFMKAKEGIELRIKKHKGYGDETVLNNILKAIAELEEPSK